MKFAIMELFKKAYDLGYEDSDKEQGYDPMGHWGEKQDREVHEIVSKTEEFLCYLGDNQFSAWIWKEKVDRYPACNHCKSPIIVTTTPRAAKPGEEPYSNNGDYFAYCSNPHCKNHSGEEIGDMEEPKFLQWIGKGDNKLPGSEK